MGVLVFTFASGSLSSLTGGFTALMTGQGNAVGEDFHVEQAAFATSKGVLALDGTPTGSETTTATATSGTLTTTGTSDVLIVETSTSSTSDPVVSGGVASTPSLTWTHRTSEVGTASTQEEWYATTTSTFSGTVKVTWTAATQSNEFYVFAVSGANTETPFDPAAGLPADTAGTTTSPAETVASTSNANDFVFGSAFVVRTAAGTCHTFSSVAAPFTLLAATNVAGATGGTDCMNGDGAYDIVSSTQSGMAITFTLSATTTQAWTMIADAIQQNPGGASLYVRNVGTVSSTLVSVYVVDQTTGTLVGQFPMSIALNVGTFVDIPSSTLAFAPSHGQTYSFTVTSSLGNSVKFSSEAS